MYIYLICNQNLNLNLNLSAKNKKHFDWLTTKTIAKQSNDCDCALIVMFFSYENEVLVEFE